jgi:hypothetical protein
MIEFHCDVASNIFTHNPSGPDNLNDFKHLSPEVAVILLAASLSGVTEGLAGASAGNKVNVLKCV